MEGECINMSGIVINDDLDPLKHGGIDIMKFL